VQFTAGLGSKQRFSIHFEARTLSGRKIMFAPLALFDVLFFVLSREVRTEKFAPQEVPSRTPN